MEKVKFETETLISTSPSILFNCLISPSGLSEWFADDVNIKLDVYTFFWDGDEDTATLLKSRKGNEVRFQWSEDEGTPYYFEMAIQIDDLTKEIALVITDFAEEDEIEEAKLLWESNIQKLKFAIGG